MITDAYKSAAELAGVKLTIGKKGQRPQDKTRHKFSSGACSLVKEIAKQIEASFAKHGVKVESSEIEIQAGADCKQIKVAPEEARGNVMNLFLKKHNIPKSEFFTTRETPQVKISDIKENGKWVMLRAKVVQWEANQESIAQVGLLGDE